MSQLFVRTGIHFSSSQQALEHIGEEMLARGVVHDSYSLALLEREATFPTGIALEQHAVAIPHCEAVHAKSPAIYLIRPDNPVPFQRDD
jgi:PTS system galactitol-specific IIA component